MAVLKISAYVTRGNGKAKLIVSFNDKTLTDGQYAMLALGYLEHVLKKADIDPKDILAEASYDPEAGELE